MTDHNLLPIQPDVYDKDYYLHNRGGSAEFRESRGRELYYGHEYSLKLAELKTTDTVLDVGCGCGEIVFHAAQQAARVDAFDYATDAIQLANEAKDTYDSAIRSKIYFHVSDVESFDWAKEKYDVVFFVDVIEHLTQNQIDATLRRIYESLKPGGRLVVHTWPNRWHRQYTYPVIHAIRKVLGRKTQRDPRTEHEKLMHISEQSPLELRSNLRRAGFSGRVFLNHFEPAKGSLAQGFHWFMHSIPPFKWGFCDDIFAVAVKS